MADGRGAMSDSSTIDKLGCLDRDAPNPGVTGVGGMLVHVDALPPEPDDDADEDEDDEGDDRLSDVADCRNLGVRGGVNGPCCGARCCCCRGVVGVGGMGVAVAE